jgi:hypothetical protein
VKALVTSCASISQNCAAPAATNSAEKITAPLTGLIASSATFAGVGSTSDRASAIASRTTAKPPRPSRRSETSAAASWARAGSGRSRTASSVPARRWVGISSSCPQAMSAMLKPRLAIAKTSIAAVKSSPPSTGTLWKIT